VVACRPCCSCPRPQPCIPPACRCSTWPKTCGTCGTAGRPPRRARGGERGGAYREEAGCTLMRQSANLQQPHSHPPLSPPVGAFPGLPVGSLQVCMRMWAVGWRPAPASHITAPTSARPPLTNPCRFEGSTDVPRVRPMSALGYSRCVCVDLISRDTIVALCLPGCPSSLLPRRPAIIICAAKYFVLGSAL
jgi:hypothetical protein